MNVDAYHAFTATLRRTLAAAPEVLGLVALGSMADVDYSPDRWSDHDFFVIVPAGAQPRWRADRAWLPEPARIMLHFQETAHGVKVVYEDGHLLEFAVFDRDELRLARINRYRVLLDRADIAATLADLQTETTRQAAAQPDDRHLLGQFFTNLLVGVARYRRGERLSGLQFVHNHAVDHLLTLLARHVPAPDHAVLDNLSVRRRFERVYPDLARELAALSLREPPAAAPGYMALAERALRARTADFPWALVDVVGAISRE